MGIDKRIDVGPRQLAVVLALLQEHLPHTEVWAYGSRVVGTSTDRSDLDLVAFARPDQLERIYDLREAFDESDLPFRVDLFVWDQIPDSFKARIRSEHTILASVQARGP
ncbi:MAG: nucleotidyltransferase domain-containing protein [Bryobacterales bacterium]|nr:nucleotidyltransferase domain-containing protein [Bryobacterales bacterium]